MKSLELDISIEAPWASATDWQALAERAAEAAALAAQAVSVATAFQAPEEADAAAAGDAGIDADTWLGRTSDNRYKIVRFQSKAPELYDLLADPYEQHNLAATEPAIAATMLKQLEDWQRSVERSLSGADY